MGALGAFLFEKRIEEEKMVMETETASFLKYHFKSEEYVHGETKNCE